MNLPKACLDELNSARAELTALLLKSRHCGMQRGDDELVKRPDGEYNESEILRGTFYECYHCGSAWPDDGEHGPTRIALDQSSHYVATRLNANPQHVGMQWPKWINRRIPWGELMLEYLKAIRLKQTRGNYELYRQWIQKDEGRIWDKALARDLRRRNQDVYDVALARQDAWRLCLIVDNQLDLLTQWVMVLAVKKDGSMRQLWRGALHGLAACRLKQLEYGLDAAGHPILKDQFVFLDGRYKPEQICGHIVEHKYGHWGTFHGEREWFAWNLMQGTRYDYFPHEEEKDRTRKFICGDAKTRGYTLDGWHVDILVYPFSATACGERFEARRDGLGAETLFLERLPDEPADEHELSHNSQIHSNKLVASRAVAPRESRMMYVPEPKTSPDHYFHMWRMAMAVEEVWGIDGVYKSVVSPESGVLSPETVVG